MVRRRKIRAEELTGTVAEEWMEQHKAGPLLRRIKRKSGSEAKKAYQPRTLARTLPPTNSVPHLPERDPSPVAIVGTKDT